MPTGPEQALSQGIVLPDQPLLALYLQDGVNQAGAGLDSRGPGRPEQTGQPFVCSTVFG